MNFSAPDNEPRTCIVPELATGSPETYSDWATGWPLMLSRYGDCEAVRRGRVFLARGYPVTFETSAPPEG